MSIFQYGTRRPRGSKNAVTKSRRATKTLWRDLPEEFIQIDGLAARVESVPLNQLQFPDYQRQVNKDWVSKLAREYDFGQHEPMRISRRLDGSLWVMDGMHRTLAIRARVGEKHQAIPTRVYVFEGLTREQEATKFIIWNGAVKQLTATHMFPAMVASGDADAAEILRVVTKYGYEVSTASYPTNGKLLSPPLRKISQVVGPTGLSPLEETVAVIAEAFQEKTGDLRNMFVEALGDFIEIYHVQDVYSRDRLVKVVSHLDFAWFKAKQKTTADLDRNKKGHFKRAGRAILFGEYNKRIQQPLTWSE